MAPFLPATPEVLIGYCGPIEWALLDAPGPTTWRRGVWGPVGPSSGPEELGVVRAGDMRGDLAIRLPLSHPVAAGHAARWMAARRGVKVRDWAHFERDASVITEHLFSLDQYQLRVDGRCVVTFLDSSLYIPGAWNCNKVLFVDGLDKLPYTEALCLACLAVEKDAQ